MKQCCWHQNPPRLGSNSTTCTAVFLSTGIGEKICHKTQKDKCNLHVNPHQSNPDSKWTMSSNELEHSMLDFAGFRSGIRVLKTDQSGIPEVRIEPTRNLALPTMVTRALKPHLRPRISWRLSEFPYQSWHKLAENHPFGTKPTIILVVACWFIPSVLWLRPNSCCTPVISI